MNEPRVDHLILLRNVLPNLLLLLLLLMLLALSPAGLRVSLEALSHQTPRFTIFSLSAARMRGKIRKAPPDSSLNPNLLPKSSLFP